MNPVGVSDSSIVCNQRFSASSSLSSSLASNGRLNGASAWIPSSKNNDNDYLQIDLGSVYGICAVATQGNPSADDWTKTYKIKTSLNNVNWQWYQESNTVKVCMVSAVCSWDMKQRFLVFKIGRMQSKTQVHLFVIKMMTII